MLNGVCFRALSLINLNVKLEHYQTLLALAFSWVLSDIFDVEGMFFSEAFSIFNQNYPFDHEDNSSKSVNSNEYSFCHIPLMELMWNIAN